MDTSGSHTHSDAAASAGSPLPPGKTVLVLRTDAIGDNVLATAMLAPLRAAHPHVRLVYACQDRVADLLTTSPHVDEVVPFSRGRAYAEEGYREDVAHRLGAIAPDLLLHPVFSREPLADALVRQVRSLNPAARAVGFAAPPGGALADGCVDEGYTDLITPLPGWRRELDRVDEFLRGIGIAPAELRPTLWLTEADRAFAREALAAAGVDPRRTAVLFAGALADYRVNRHLGAALENAWAGGDVISVGAAHEFALHKELMRGWPAGRHVNLCGRTTLRQTAALLEAVSLAVGAETGAAHLACAVGTRNVVVLGGGHFGRFMPWSPLTTAACLPLECYGCDWKCRHTRAHCVQDVTADTVAAAIAATRQATPDRPTLVLQAATAAGGPAAEPAALHRWLGGKPATLVPLEAIAAAVPPRPEMSPGPLPAPAAPEPAFRLTALVGARPGDGPIRDCLQDLVVQTLFTCGQMEIVILSMNHLESAETDAAAVRSFQATFGAGRIRVATVPGGLAEAPAAMWNRGVDAARGAYLTVARPGERRRPEMLAVLAAALDGTPAAAVAYAGRNGGRGAAFDRETLFSLDIVGPHPVWRRAAHRDVGYFDTSFAAAAGYEFWLRLAGRHQIVHIDRALSYSADGTPAGAAWAYETRVARDRHWDRAWGPPPDAGRVAAAFAGLGRRAAALGGGRVALFGAGQHTRRHLDRFRAAAGRAQLAAILDDKADGRAAQAIDGLQVLPTGEWAGLGLAGVIVSSDTYEAAMAARVREATAGALPVLAVYEPGLDYWPATAPAGAAAGGSARH